MLFIDHDKVVIQELDLDGALVVEGTEGVSVAVKGLHIRQDKGWEWRALHDGDDAEEHEKIR